MGKMNKKGLVLKFLVTILLALIIFVPACYMGAKLFRVSDQAKDNYVDLVEELNKFSKEAEIGARESTLLIMDKATALVYFEKGKEEVLVEVDARIPYSDFIIHLQKPVQCEEGKNCLCLFRKSEFESSLGTPGYDTITVAPKRVLCTNLNYQLELESCSIGEPEVVNGYKCSDGFMIERHLVDESSLVVRSYYQVQRRTLLYLTKFENMIRIQGPLQNE